MAAALLLIYDETLTEAQLYNIMQHQNVDAERSTLLELLAKGAERLVIGSGSVETVASETHSRTEDGGLLECSFFTKV